MIKTTDLHGTHATLVHICLVLRQHIFHFNAALKKMVLKVKIVQLWAHQFLN